MEYECIAGSDFSGCIAPIVQVYYNFCVETVASPHDNLPKQTSKQKKTQQPLSFKDHLYMCWPGQLEQCRNYNKNKADCLQCHKNKATIYALHCVLSTAEKHPLWGFKLGSWPCPVRLLRGS